MGTRGAYGLHYKGVDKVSYNHYDSYPSCLGEDILKFAVSYSEDELKKFFEKIVMVKEDDKPTSEQIALFQDIINNDVGGTQNTWYNLLRNLQGNLGELYIREKPYMIDNANFLEDSLFCEWAYIINLDKRVLEIYEGFQKTKPPKNRFAIKELSEDSNYWNCKLVREISFDDPFFSDASVVFKGLDE